MARTHQRQHALEHRALDAAFDAHAREHIMLQRAIDKAEHGLGDRLEGLNEARGRANDERQTYATRPELALRADAIDERLKRLENAQAAATGRDRGISLAWGVLLGVVGIGIGVVGFAVTRGGL